jgi:uncharacterized membrane protein
MHELLHRLVARFTLSPAQSTRLWQLSGLHAPSAELARQTERGLGAVAALLLGAGLIFWVAANWQDQTRQFKFYLIQAVLAASLALALAWPRGRTALLLLSTLALGGLLAFIGQTYQTGADPWQLFAAWGALALLWMLAARSDGLWALWVLIVGSGIGLWSGDQMFNPGSILWGHRGIYSVLTPALWALLVLVIALVARMNLVVPAGQVPGRLSFRLAVLGALSAWCTYGLWALFSKQLSSLFLVNALFVVGAGAIAWVTKPRDITVLAMVVLALDVLFLGCVLKLLFFSGGSKSDYIGLTFMFACIAAATVGISGTWVYKLQRAEQKP